MKHWIWYGVTILLIGLDQITKYLASAWLTLHRSVKLFPGLDWTLTYNSGSAFGFLNQSGVWWHAYFFTVLGVVMSLGLAVWMALCNTKARLELFGLSCILSGAVGNVLDRMRLGYVIDFIHVYYKSHSFPIFNIADSAVCIGAFILFYTNRRLDSK